MNAKRVKALTLKELLVQSKDSATLSTIVVIPLLFGIAIPILLLLLGTSNPLVQSLGGMQFILDSASSFTVGQRVNAGSETLYVILMYLFIPIFMLLPTMISNVTAAASFVGEREQKTIEGLLYTPLTRQELIFGKIAASFLPATIVTWIAVIIYGLLLDTLGYPIFGRMIFPNATWVFLSIIITPLVSFLSTLLVVAISQKVKTTKSAQSVSLLVIVPIMGMIVYQANDLASLGFGTVILLAVIIFFVDVILFCFITHNFKSETFLIGK